MTNAKREIAFLVAAQVLAVVADPSTRPTLVEALGNPDGGVSRIYAIKGLSMIYCSTG